MKKVMTIAGSDSGAGAGIQADLKAIAAMGAYGTSAITSITAQNTLGVQNVFNLPLTIIADQIESILDDIGAHAVKTGMLATGDIISLVADKVKKYNIKLLVVDPVMVSTSGDVLLQQDALDNLKNCLLPLAYITTPNMREAEVLSGQPVTTLSEMKEAAKKIYSFGPKNVVVKGGHLEGEAIDVLYNGKEFKYFKNPKVDTKNTHGTGCTFAAALAANLAFGFEVEKALQKTKEYITGALKDSLDVGQGAGPVNHFWKGQIE